MWYQFHMKLDIPETPGLSSLHVDVMLDEKSPHPVDCSIETS